MKKVKYNTPKRNIDIYNEHKSGIDIERLSYIYGLKQETIKRIIRDQKKLINNRETFMKKLDTYVRKNYNNTMASSIVLALSRYFNKNYIIKVDEIISVIKDDKVYIRGIGEKYKLILDEFLSTL